MASVLYCMTLTHAVMTKSGSDVDIVNDVWLSNSKHTMLTAHIKCMEWATLVIPHRYPLVAAYFNASTKTSCCWSERPGSITSYSRLAVTGASAANLASLLSHCIIRNCSYTPCWLAWSCSFRSCVCNVSDHYVKLR